MENTSNRKTDKHKTPFVGSRLPHLKDKKKWSATKNNINVCITLFIYMLIFLPKLDSLGLRLCSTLFFFFKGVVVVTRGLGERGGGELGSCCLKVQSGNW